MIGSDDQIYGNVTASQEPGVTVKSFAHLNFSLKAAENALSFVGGLSGYSAESLRAVHWLDEIERGKSGEFIWSPLYEATPQLGEKSCNIAATAFVYGSGLTNSWRIMAGPIGMRLPIPAVVTREAVLLLSRLPRQPVTAVMNALADWLEKEKTRAERVRILTVMDPESPDWVEVVVEIVADLGVEETLDLWKNLSRQIDDVKSKLDFSAIEVINRSFGFHIVSPSEDQSVGDI